jgi:hypothetical protein
MKNKNPDSEGEEFESIPGAGGLAELIEWLRSKNPEAAQYLESHSWVDEQTGTIYYTGDDRIRFWGDKHGEMPVKHLDPEASEAWPSKHPKSGN